MEKRGDKNGFLVAILVVIIAVIVISSLGPSPNTKYVRPTVVQTQEVEVAAPQQQIEDKYLECECSIKDADTDNCGGSTIQACRDQKCYKTIESEFTNRDGLVEKRTDEVAFDCGVYPLRNCPEVEVAGRCDEEEFTGMVYWNDKLAASKAHCIKISGCSPRSQTCEEETCTFSCAPFDPITSQPLEEWAQELEFFCGRTAQMFPENRKKLIF